MPQGMLIIEQILEKVAQQMDIPLDVLREKNMYNVSAGGRLAHVWSRGGRGVTSADTSREEGTQTGD